MVYETNNNVFTMPVVNFHFDTFIMDYMAGINTCNAVNDEVKFLTTKSRQKISL